MLDKFKIHWLFLLFVFGHTNTLANDFDTCFKSNSNKAMQVNACENSLPSLKRDTQDYLNVQLQLLILYTSQGAYSLANQTDTTISTFNLTSYPLIQQFKYLRHRGILQYRQGLYPQALLIFEQAYQLAKTDKHSLLQAKALSDIGTANMAMANHKEAISAFHQSLLIKQQVASKKSIAITLNNLGSVYLKMKDWGQAEHYYSLALTIYRNEGNKASEAHSLENIAVVQMKQGKYTQASVGFKQSLHFFTEKKQDVAQLRLLINMAELNLLQQQLPQAREHLELAQRIESRLGNNALTIPLKLNLGKLFIQQGLYQQAESILKTGLTLSLENKDSHMTTDFYQALIDNAVKFFRWEQAFIYERKLEVHLLQGYQLKFDQSLANTRVQFEYERQQQAIELLDKKNKINDLLIQSRNTQLLVLSLFFIIMAAGMYGLYYRQKQHRLAEQRKLEYQINWHRKRVKQLGVSHSALKAAFGQLPQALLVVSNSENLVYINQSGCDLLHQDETQLVDCHLETIFPRTSLNFWEQWDSDSELDNVQVTNVDIKSPEGPKILDIWLTNISRGEPIAVINMVKHGELASQSPINSLLSDQDFQHKLVDLMFHCVEFWETTTQSTRIELAEKSGIWRVSIDDGRLRTRSLDRYLSVQLLPKKPRWREVLRTAHYVIAECQLDSEQECTINLKLTALNQHLHTKALL
jgi:two-component system sensor histidine kinase ChiS